MTTVIPNHIHSSHTATLSNEQQFWGDDGLSFDDVLDVLNPLQHIPLVNNLYREVTGDTISQGSQLVGSGIYGGVAGFIGSFFSSAVTQVTGTSPVDYVMDLFSTDEPTNDFAGDGAPVVIAEASDAYNNTLEAINSFPIAIERNVEAIDQSHADIQRINNIGKVNASSAPFIDLNI